MREKTKNFAVVMVLVLLVNLFSGMTAVFGGEETTITGELQTDGSIWYKTTAETLLTNAKPAVNYANGFAGATSNTVGGYRGYINCTGSTSITSDTYLRAIIHVEAAGNYEIKFGGQFKVTYGKIQINDGEKVDMQEVDTDTADKTTRWDTAGTFALKRGENTITLYHTGTKAKLCLDTISIKAVSESAASPAASPETSPSPEESPIVSASPEASPDVSPAAEQIFTFWGNEDKLTATKPIDPTVSWSQSVQNNYVYPNNKRDSGIESSAEKYYVLYQEKETNQTLTASIPVDVPGIYDVYFLNPLSSAGNEASAQITINNTRAVSFDMTQGGWHKIATYQLDDEMNFRAQMTTAPKNMRFDSIKLVPAGPDASPEPTVDPSSPSPSIEPSPEEGVYYIDDGDSERFKLVYDSEKGTEVGHSNRDNASYNDMHTYCSVPGAYGTFSLSGIPSGIYEIYYHFPLKWEQNAREVLITVDDRNGGTASETFNSEEIETGSWQKIGNQFTILSENPGYVRAKNPDYPDGRSVIRFDAVKLVKVGNVQVPPSAKDVAVTGSLKPGSVLNGSFRFVSESGFAPGDSIQKWYRSDKNDNTAVWTEISTGSSYTLGEQDAGKYIKYEVTPKAITDNPALQTGKTESIILGPVPAGEIAPQASNIQIQGKLAEFMVLTASYEYSDANLDPEAGTVYQWYTGDTKDHVTTRITGASGTVKQGDSISYTLKESDVGKYIRLGIIPKNQLGTGQEVFSDIKGPVEVISADMIPYANNPVVIGTGAEGYSVSIGYQYNHPYQLAEGNSTYQWYISDSRNGVYTPITGATSKTYQITAGQFGKYIKASVTPVTQQGQIAGTTVTTEPIAVKWKLSWSDEFDYTAADGLDPNFTKTWIAESKSQAGRLLGGRWPENVEVSGGSLKLKQKKEVPQKGGQDWSSASVGTVKDDFGYGRYEASYKYAAATGINNAFWFTSPDWGKEGFYEIDVNEGHYPNQVNTNVHFYGGSASGPYQVPGAVDLAQDYHVYTFDWSEDELVFAIDGIEIRRMDNTSCKTDTYTAQLLFSTAIMNWSGEITDAVDGTVMEVDYVRYFRSDDDYVDTESLAAAIDKANRTLKTSKAGSTVACYSQNRIDSLQTAVNTAQAVLDKGPALTSAEVKSAAAALSSALDAFYNNMVSFGDVKTVNSPVYIPEYFNKAITISQSVLSNNDLEIKLLANKPLAKTLIIEYPYRTSKVTITIPQGTCFGGEADADGYVTLKLPKGELALSAAVPGKKLHVLDMGDLSVGSRAIRIQITGLASKDLGYVRDGDLIKVTDTISTGIMEEALLLVEPNSMKRNDLGDGSLDIWTRTLNPIVVYEANGTGEEDEKPNIVGKPNPPYYPDEKPSPSPSEEPTVSPSTEPTNNPVDFKDIKDHWAEKEIVELAEQDIIKGVTEDEFMPDKSITRAEFTALIVRTLGLQLADYKNGFNDVKETDWFAQEIQTALENGIISKDEMFRPNDTMTREEMTKVMVEALKNATGEEDLEKADLGQFKDENEISGWAKEYVAEALHTGLIKGISEDEFSPKTNATRAQGAVMIHRLLGMIAKG